MVNCPICGRHLGEFLHDPILTTPSLSTDEFKGFMVLVKQDIEELQAERHQQEIDNGVSPLTEFSPINDTGFFQNIKQYIIELRDSTQKILLAVGIPLSDFLSTDEDGHSMTFKSDWSDSELEEITFQAKAIHIEDLRHFIQGVSAWIERWSGFPNHVYLNETHLETGEDWGYSFPMGAVSGNKGDWNSLASASRQAGTFPGFPITEHDSVLAECDITSEKLTLHTKTQGLMIVPPGGSGVNTGLVSNMQIHNDLTYLLSPATIFTFDLTNFVNTASGLVNFHRIRFSITVGSHTWFYDLTSAGLNINVHNEYVSRFGTPPVGVNITMISFSLDGKVFPLRNPGDTGQFELKCTLDNIKFIG